MERPSGELTLHYGKLRLALRPAEPNVYYTTYFAGEYDYLRIGPGDVVLDAGANVGDFAVLASGLVGPQGRVIAVEPNPSSLKLMRINLQRNSANNVTVVNKFISDRKKVVEVKDVGTYTVTTGSTEPDSRSTEASDLDSILASLSVARVDVAKIDIEGMEDAAIRDQRYLDQVRELAIEVHSRSLETQVLQRLNERGFESEIIDGSRLYRNFVRNFLSHPISYLRAELATKGFGMRAIWQLLRGKNPIGLASPESEIRLYHAWRK